MLSDRHPPAFTIGERVRVIVNERNHTARSGVIERMVWHYKDQRWYFFLRDDAGRRVGKRYAAEDLSADRDAPMGRPGQ